VAHGVHYALTPHYSGAIGILEFKGFLSAFSAAPVRTLLQIWSHLPSSHDREVFSVHRHSAYRQKHIGRTLSLKSKTAGVLGNFDISLYYNAEKIYLLDSGINYR
jgi:hypothetical protein